MTAAALVLLAPYAGRSVVNAGAVMWHGVTDDTLARAHALLGDGEAVGPSSSSRAGDVRADRREAGGGTGFAHSSGRARCRTDHRSVHLHQQPGGLWLVGREGATFVLPRMRGLAHLHALLSRPDTDLPAVNLVGGEVVEQTGLEVLDDESRRILGTRLSELDNELAQSDRPELRDERDAVASYLPAQPGSAVEPDHRLARRTRPGRGPQGDRGCPGQDRRGGPVARPPPARPGPHRLRVPLRVRSGTPVRWILHRRAELGYPPEVDSGNVRKPDQFETVVRGPSTTRSN